MTPHEKMKILLSLVVWLLCIENKVNCHGIGFGIKSEIFFLNLEDGYFGCQVNESTDFLQLYELSRLCDGVPDCFKASDELRRELKCTNDCNTENGQRCQNGVCLDSQCHCNDGFGGCACEVPDENECKNRPCDVFAHCTNTLGGFQCTCFPGYFGDGLHCQDINECEDPAIAARCVEHAECCNLPAHWLCKCKPGFKGDGEHQCTDIDECVNPNACGHNAACINTIGNYTCDCLPGYAGNPFNGCGDVDECQYVGACGQGAICTNFDGGHECSCPPGMTGDPHVGCGDIDECATSPCGYNAICTDTEGSFRCDCPPGHVGDPFRECTDVDECASGPCGEGALCADGPGTFNCSCPDGFSGNPMSSCHDIDECADGTAVCGVNAKCTNTVGSYSCSCQPGTTGDPKAFCQNIDECKSSPCGKNAVCKDTIGSYACQCKEDYSGDPYIGCTDIDECKVLERPCGSNAICENSEPGYNCVCPQGFAAKPNPTIACEQVDVSILCRSNFDCTNNAECIEGQCFCRDGFRASGSTCMDVDECLIDPCGPDSVCDNRPGGFECRCMQGFVGAPPQAPCKAPCSDVKCGDHAFCREDGHEAHCVCEDGWSYNPRDITAGCVDVNECDKSLGPWGKCGEKAVCTNSPGGFSCLCPAGFSGDPFKLCTDVDECSDSNACGTGAICTNSAGSFTCSCPSGTIPDPDPSVRCVSVLTCKDQSDCPGNAVCDDDKRCFCPEPNIGNDCRHPCEEVSCGANAECTLVSGQAQCLCRAGYTGTGRCVDIDECQGNPCASGAVCTNSPGGFSCQCPRGSVGDPHNEGCSRLRSPESCSKERPCGKHEVCVEDKYLGDSLCICQRGYMRDQTGKCVDVDECTSGDKPACGLNALCKNLPGSYECSCPQGFNGNPYMLCQECDSLECQCRPPYKIVNKECVLADCSKKKKCPSGAECITIAGGVSYCACPDGFQPDEDGKCIDIDECQESSGAACGFGAECHNTVGGHECKCPQGYSGDPTRSCSPNQIRCAADSDCGENEKCLEPGECSCPPPFFVDTSASLKCTSPCARLACGVNAKCIVSDPPKCLCKSGYRGDPLIGCTAGDECAANPCARGALCLNKPSGFKCVCPPGAAGDPYIAGCMGAAAKQECRSDKDCALSQTCAKGSCINPCSAMTCGANAQCYAEEHSAQCRCNVGFIKSPSGICQSPCSGMECGRGAQCIATASGSACRCPDGYHGNPYPGGSCEPDICSATRPCISPRTCINGRCRERCAGVVCGVGALCDPVLDRCVCSPFFVGNPALICVPPIAMATCSPNCGTNAHCEYGLAKSDCVCDSGTTGNPYKGCEPPAAERVSCLDTQCGKGAVCRDSPGGSLCACPPGHSGNPYVQCADMNECAVPDVCGENAVCLNTPGSFDCRCRENYVGNPFIGCMRLAPQVCTDPAACVCSPNNHCPAGYKCKKNKCKSECEGVKCGPRSGCVGGKCVCPPGLNGNPYDLKRGCSGQDQCANDLDCKQSEICFAVGRGVRECVNACTKVQCGPNALCLAAEHRSRCICPAGTAGDPSDLVIGCTPLRHEPAEECSRDVDCERNYICALDADGLRKCVDPCSSVVCGLHEACGVESGRPICRCAPGYIRDPTSAACRQPGVPECSVNTDCPADSACHPDTLGVPKCTPVCDAFTCPANAECIAAGHDGQCQCLPGYTGNPDDRTGCVPAAHDHCASDAQCAETETCVHSAGAAECRDACSTIRCGTNALCVTSNHVARCQCPPGPFAGDPLVACIQVPCISNRDCPADRACDRQSHSCIPVCGPDACGSNAVCFAKDQRPACQCPPGFRPNPSPEVECSEADVCQPSPCHRTAACYPGPGFTYSCRCPAGTVGDPFASGCRPEGVCPGGDADCPPTAVCQGGRCVNPCDRACGPNALCTVRNRKPVCTCPPSFEPLSAAFRAPCVRSAQQCTSDIDCSNEVCINGQCSAVCRKNEDCLAGERCMDNKCQLPCASHSQCLPNQVCSKGICIIGCRNNKECPSHEACIKNKCQDPCSVEGVCGANAECTVSGQTAVCSCPDHFVPDPVAEQGCVRALAHCSGPTDCPNGHACVTGVCKAPCSGPHDCAQGERCQAGACDKVCFSTSNCLPGETCVDGVCTPGCSADSDCADTEHCSGGICTCLPGFVSTELGCRDTDECANSPCHPAAVCTNAPGSFHCSCPPGTVGDPYSLSGCKKPDRCTSDAECPAHLTCFNAKCTNPCDRPDTCGPGAECSVRSHMVACDCPQGRLGDPYDHTVGCFKVDCMNDEECPTDRFCHQPTFKCLNPCDSINCGQGTCKVQAHQGVCSCYHGFRMIGNTCKDIDECLAKPCHPSAMCINTEGGYRCVCEEGFVGEAGARGCRPAGACVTDTDCPGGATCVSATCRDPCLVGNPCGENALCTTTDHLPVCSCPHRTTGDPKVECTRVECISNADCPAGSAACVGGACRDPCLGGTACGANAECTVTGSVAVCSCRVGTTGDPHLGCIPLQYCSADVQCNAGAVCTNGVCQGLCSSSRDCFGSQLCIQGVCQPTCVGNSSCPDFQYCQNNICVQEQRCYTDNDCQEHQHCVSNSFGQSSCENICDGEAVCGRNADCSATKHQAVCACQRGYHGNPAVGCIRTECRTTDDCSDDKLCEGHICKISCLVHNPCGANAICSAEKHKQMCYCQPGYTGDAQAGCRPIDYCSRSPCAEGAMCVNARGSYKCVCPVNTVGNPYESGCRSPVGCRLDSDCPDAAKCSAIKNNATCRDACSDVVCGANAECRAIEHKGMCNCRLGYDGMPADLTIGCRPVAPPCTTNSDCPTDTYCYAGQCRSACRSDSECGLDEQCLVGHCSNPCRDTNPCGVNAVCQVQAHVKSCSCPPGFTGDHAVECLRIPTSCSKDDDCPEKSFCDREICRPRCSTDNECALNEKCLRNTCILTCRVDNDCFLGHICVRGTCLFGCRVDEDCSASEACRNNVCRDPCAGSPCGPNAICSVSNQRAVCSCRAGFVPVPSAGVACLREPAPPCSESRHCKPGMICTDGSCMPVCSADNNCLSNERCDQVGSVCRSFCRRDDDCRAGEICPSGDLLCSTGCRSDSSCPSDKQCIDNKCLDPCEARNACGANAMCVVKGHEKSCSCPPGLTGDPDRACSIPLAACIAGHDCPPGHRCYAGACAPSCLHDKECLSDERCVEGLCRAVCNTDGKCSAGQICRDRVCTEGCRFDSACPDSMACYNNRCVDPCSIEGDACGPCAECTVTGHTVRCGCLPGLVGDPAAAGGCTPPRLRCNSTCDCDQATFTCVERCSSDSDCRCGQTCVSGRCAPVCSSNMPCPQGEICDGGACRAGCRSDLDCPSQRSCERGSCIDPCRSGDACGKGAECHAFDHRAVCTCPAGWRGQPSVECTQAACIKSADCADTETCDAVAGVCANPCLLTPCGVNAQCKAVRHEAKCSCPPGYRGNPLIKCIAAVSDNCGGECGENSMCRQSASGWECSCAEGCHGDPRRGCACDRNIDRPCDVEGCGINAACRHKPDGRVICYCPLQFPLGDPKVKCIKSGDCRTQGCGVNAVCSAVANDEFVCKCPPGSKGDPNVKCKPSSVLGCLTDDECPSYASCLNGKCQNPCLLNNPCASNEECQVHQHHTACVKVCQCQKTSDCRSAVHTCDGCHCIPIQDDTSLVVGERCNHCPPGTACDPLTGACIKAPQQDTGCKLDSECAHNEACASGNCVNVCAAQTVCARNALCQGINHKAVCSCPPNMLGDPFSNCYSAPVTTVECTVDAECPSRLACINNRCDDPCRLGNACGTGAECFVVGHRPSCSCPQAWAGDPQTHCYRPECKVDSDCFFDKVCIGGNCVSPCLRATCGRGSECRAQAHSAVCFCPAGTQGDPYVSCVSVQCHYNEDCADTEACDRLNRVCRPACQQDTCAEGATCVARKHQPVCTCKPGTQGDPYVQCIDARVPIPSGECSQDADCGSGLACLERHCTDPCQLPAICGHDQVCRVIDTLPVRTVMCQCPSDSVSASDGHCTPIVSQEVECRRDTECRDSERCVRNQCRDACTIDPCGYNAQCLATGHQALCTCPPGYEGEPRLQCYPKLIGPVSLPPAECAHNSDCAGDRRCENALCVNPCAVGSPCASNAFCYVSEHQPSCRCPPGYTGNPQTRCTPPADAVTVGCVSNSECAPREACVNRLCLDPCNCGPNAECRVADHYPICYCKPGFTGNPQVGCTKIGCESDSQCAGDKTCYNGECINVCVLNDPCGANAECFGRDHRSECRCLSGMRGDPHVRCAAPECRVDADCPDPRACVSEHCVNPCENACSPTAVCRARSHSAVCRCPEEAPLGDPLSHCYRSPPPTAATPECSVDPDCPGGLACINSACVDPCIKLGPCHSSATCAVSASVPVRTMLCTCRPGWLLDVDGSCKPVAVPSPPGCQRDDDCSSNETCINRRCRNPCDCGINAQCLVQNHRPVCSCVPGYHGDPHMRCSAVGCRSDSECHSGLACTNGNCVDPCVVHDPCGPNAECFAIAARAECRCKSGFRGNPYDRCHVVGCRSNADCPSDRNCVNAQCVDPCVYQNPCAPNAQCSVRNHLAVCRCPPGQVGNPYTACREEPMVECYRDADCAGSLACLNSHCADPCVAGRPCQAPASCSVAPSLPVRTMTCVCPPGYASAGAGVCQPTPPVQAIGECAVDSDCASDKACLAGVCRDPCNCGPNAECRVADHKPVCSCILGYEGNPDIECVLGGCRSDNDCRWSEACLNRQCVPACSPDGSSCGTDALCTGAAHHAVCSCPPGTTGDARVGCTQVECITDSDCPSRLACINDRCADPCVGGGGCLPPSTCLVHNHRPSCTCPSGFVLDSDYSCKQIEVGCRADYECPSQTACINGDCINPCEVTKPCGVNTRCVVFDTLPVRTMICECLPGYVGDASVRCDKVSECAVEKGFVRDALGECVCPPGTGLSAAGHCEPCPPERGLRIDERGRCVCDLERGHIVDERGNCVCPTEHGFYLDYNGNCVPRPIPECETDSDCADHHFCDSGTCRDPCHPSLRQCGVNAVCNATNHKAICHCIVGYTGDPYVLCNTTQPVGGRTEFPRPDMLVSCLSDGVQVEIHIEEKGFNGVLYVKGHSKDERCRRVVSLPNDSLPRTEVFKVNFGTCGLIHVNGQASFVLVIQKHPMLVTFKTQAYHIRCVYTTGEQNVTLGFNVSMLTTAGTIANTGPPPTCIMRIVTQTGQEVNSAEIGDNLMLQVEVEPASIYGGFARSCVAKTMEDSQENEYTVTDENGCATDPTIFGEWDYSTDTHALSAGFNAFKFPSSDNIRFQCNIRVCFGRCQPVNCRGYNAYGRRKRAAEQSNVTDAALTDSVSEGQLREEITIQSNAILTFERREERFTDPTEAPMVERVEDICVSMVGFIIALVVTALLALVAVAVAVSCWLIAYRQQAAQRPQPLPHPPDFPNPLFSPADRHPVAEPSPDYLS